MKLGFPSLQKLCHVFKYEYRVFQSSSKKIFSSGAHFPINSDENVKDFPGNSTGNKGIIILFIEFILCSRPSVNDLHVLFPNFITIL